jgi:microsomal dipeptidase-like Zn-dependent dipeptidase
MNASMVKGKVYTMRDPVESEKSFEVGCLERKAEATSSRWWARVAAVVLVGLLCQVTILPAFGQTRGYADLHAHWFSNLVPGGLQPYQDLSGVYCPYNVFPSNNATLAQQAECSLGGSGYPDLTDRPRFDEGTDQKAFYDWLKRSRDLGHRLSVVMAVYNNLACTNPISGLHRYVQGVQCDAEYAVNDQIQQLKRFVEWVKDNDPDPWLDIAYTPDEAEAIMAAGNLAVVIGVEVDDLMNCGKSPCSTTDITRKLQRLHALGVRHMFPIHGVNNAFGGSGFFNEIYGTQQWVYYPWANWFDVRECSTPDAYFRFRGVEGFGKQSFGTGNNGGWVAGNHFAYHPITVFDSEWYLNSHCNALGLTTNGEHLVETMMRLGMLIDVDHMSERSFDGVYQKAIDSSFQSSLGRTGHYPLVASHIGLRDMRPNRTSRWAHLGLGMRNGNIAGEAHKTTAQMAQISNTGGIVAPILTQAESMPYSGSRPKVANTCTDSVRSWAQVYLRTLDLMGGQNVALATDLNGQAPLPGPRFGKMACADGKQDGTRVNQQKAGQITDARPLIYNQYSSVLQANLTKQTTGNRTFDLNSDGVAHVGMVPDMLADLENLGMATADLDVVMNSAQAYVNVWRAAQPNRNFEPRVTNVIYHGISQSAPAAFVGSRNCPALGGSLGQDARWWEFEVSAGATGFALGSTFNVSGYPSLEACIIDGTTSTPIRVAIPIAPKAPWSLAAYDSDRWELIVIDALSSHILTRGIRLAVDRPTADVTRLGPTAVEGGDCPAFSPEEEPGTDREIVSDAIYRPTGMKMRQDLEATVRPHQPDFAPASYSWTAESPSAILSTTESATVEFCPCGDRLMNLTVEEVAGIETVELGFLMSAPELSLTASQEHIDQFGTIIHDPRRSNSSAATVELSVTPFRSSGTPVCTWPELRWRDAGSANGYQDEVDLDPSRLQLHGDGCQATLTLWDPAIDGGSAPSPKTVRGVVKMEDGVQCGKTLISIDSSLIAELPTHDFRVKPVRPAKIKIGPAGIAAKTLKFKIENVIDDKFGDIAVEPVIASIEVTNLDCPDGMLNQEVLFDDPFDGDSSTTLIESGGSAQARLTIEARSEWIEPASSKVPVRCSIEVRAIGPDESDITTDNSAVFMIDVYDRNAENSIAGAEVVVRPLKKLRATIRGTEFPALVKMKAKVENRGDAPTNVSWQLSAADCGTESAVEFVGGEIFLEPGQREKLQIDLTAFANDFPESSSDHPSRCHIGLVATSDDDVDPSNNVATTVMEVRLR